MEKNNFVKLRTIKQILRAKHFIVITDKALAVHVNSMDKFLDLASKLMEVMRKKVDAVTDKKRKDSELAKEIFKSDKVFK